MSQKRKQFTRSKLGTSNFIKWLRTRYLNNQRRNNSYLYFPQQLVRQTSIQQIFTEFDADGSGGLSRTEVFEMFNSFGISITMQDLNQLYDSVEVNLEELDCNMFKKCALSEKSNKVFRQIVKKLDKQSQKKYMPHNFTNMIIYLVYLSKRQELKSNLDINKGVNINDKVKSMETLLKLKDLSLNNEKLNLHTDNFKHNLKNQFRDIWQKVNERYHQKYPYTPKLEEQFFEYYQDKYKKTEKENRIKKQNMTSNRNSDFIIDI